MVAKSGLCVAALAALSMVAAQNASAAVIPVNSYNPDGIFQQGGGIATDEGDLKVGMMGWNLTRVALYPFQLPTLPVGEVVTGAVLSTYVASNLSPNFNVDVYAVRVAAGTGIDGADGTGGTLIQAVYATSSTSTNGRIDTDAAASTALATYLNSNYVAGNQVFIRLGFDNPTPTGEIWFGANDWGGGTDSTAGPRGAILTLTTGPAVPEPASLGLLGLATLGLAARRRRQA